jgi:outer membrane lipoprotein SlyB
VGEPRRSRRARIADALIWGALLGASSGAVLGAALDGVGAVAGAIAGAVVMASVETLVRGSRGPDSRRCGAASSPAACS